METNWIAILVSALIPLLVGAVWYNPRVMGKAWMDSSGMTEEMVKTGNMVRIFILTLMFSILLAGFLNVWVVHQIHINSILMNEPGFGDPNSEIGMFISDFMYQYGTNFRTFQHGAAHGFLAALMFAFPLLAINAQFERRSWKYILVHLGYWMITLILMCGLISAWI
ncbi:MAG: DUF1761 domain-containing protein [Saprospiraceae bacterium]|nr:DUF1761 domain-containing protein [Saprospiraceae bacterium]